MSSQPGSDPLVKKATVKEQPFTSTVPLLGPLIAAFRHTWNSVATRWYVRAIVDQQNQFNAALVEQLRQAEARLVELDRHNSQLTRQIAALTAQIARLKANMPADDE